MLAAIDSGPQSLSVVRRAKRLAERLRAPWTVVHVQTADRNARAASERLLAAFRLAEELGAETRTLAGGDAVAEILDFARRENVTHLVVGSAGRPLWLELIRGSLVRRLVRGAGDIAIEIAPQEERRERAPGLRGEPIPDLGAPTGYLGGLTLVTLATGFAVALDRNLTVDLPNISLVYMLAVAAASIRYGLAVSMFTAAASGLAYNFFLIPPFYTFTIADPANVYAFVFFLAAGLIVSGVASRARAQTLIARRQARQASDLAAFARALVAADSAAEIGRITTETASKLLIARAVLLAPGQTRALEQVGEAPGPEFLGHDDEAAARWAFERNRAAGRGSDTLTGARWLFIPAPGEAGPAGILGVRPQDEASRLDPEERRLLDVIAAQAGVALDRARLSAEAADARVEAESERLKGALLDSVGHDLRTPLSTVKTALESLERFEGVHDRETRKQLLGAARAEADRLARFVENLLDMNRIEAGVVRAKRERCEVSDLVDAAITRAAAALGDRHVARHVSTGLPAVLADAALAEGALANVLENAAKYTPAHSPLQVRAHRRDGKVAIEILDEGPGLAPETAPLLFGKFVRGVEGDGRPPGTGLGLAIARGFLVAQGGAIEAENRSDRSGALFRILLPEAPA